MAQQLASGLPACDPVARLVYDQVESIDLEVANSEQPNSQRRFTVIELPVFSIVKQSLRLPGTYLAELIIYGGIPYLLILVADAIGFILEREDVSRSAPGILIGIAHFVLFTPFSVTWTKLAIYGRPAIATEPPFAYSRTSWIYLLASTVMTVLLMICVGPGATLLRYSQQTLDNRIGMEAAMLILAGLFVFALVFVRLAFVFPAIAIGKYAGIVAAWRQTAGNLEWLAAIVVLSYAPYYVVRRVFEWFMGYHPPGPASVARGCVDMLLIALATTALAGPALAYKTLVLDEHRDAPALSQASPRGQ